MSPRATDRLRVGFFGLLGQGNLGNDGSFEVMLSFLRTRHPHVEIDVLCSGPSEIALRFGLPAAKLNWNRHEYETAEGVRAKLVKLLGKAIDPLRIAAWVRRHDVVIVPGMGVLESVPPLRPWAMPYSLFLVCAAGKVQRRRIALISVGADRSVSTVTRWLIGNAAKMAAYRSFRDASAREVMAGMGVDTSGDGVYPDLVFALPQPELPDHRTGVVGLGVIDYHGGYDDLGRPDEVHAEYLASLTRFACWLVDNGWRVRLLTGDRGDTPAAQSVLAGVQRCRPVLADAITAATPESLTELQDEIAGVDAVVASRFHNVLCAVKLAKPTISLGYAPKNDVLLASVGLDDFCQSLGSLDIDRLIAQFRQLLDRHGELVGPLRAHAAAKAELLEQQFVNLSRILLVSTTPDVRLIRRKVARP
jgi:polysaccharide pyruvyl transferase WcaK-like protein